jgi:DNA-binding NtrC family response regulator
MMISAYDQAETAVRCLKAGARDYLTKPLQLEELLIRVDRLVAESDQDRRAELAARLGSGLGAELIGTSAAIGRVRELIEIARRTQRTTVMIRGESGTGKELVARALHRGPGDFVAVNCTALPEHLIESELFGHEKGAFTDAREARKGYFELAQRGTIFLDEVGDLPPAAQAKLLRVLEDRVVQRVGGRSPIPIDIQVVAATHRDLEEGVRSGRFRADLYFRLDGFPIELPPLRSRPGDVPLLARHFLAGLAAELKRPPPELEAGAVAALESYPWPGNVRELKNALERALLLARGGVLAASDLSLRGPVQATGDSLGALLDEGVGLDELERRYVLAALDRHGGRRGKVAAALGIDPKTLYRKLLAWGVPGRKDD